MTRRSFDMMERLFCIALPLAFGALAVALGKDVNWDLLHYHFYNPHAWLHGRFGQDLLAADFHVFFNPLLDLPFYLGERWLPGVTLTFFLGALHGVNGVLIWRIAVHMIPGTVVLPAIVMLIGMLGAGSLYVAGTTYYDALVALPVFGAILVIGRAGASVFDAALRHSLPVLLIAGLLAGAAVGLKQTVAVFAAGVGIGIMVMAGRRILLPAAYGAGIVLGVLLTSGFWLLHLWQLTGNPFFPYFNGIFQSPLAPQGDNRTRHAMPKGIWEALLYPFVFTLAPWRVDSPVRDLKLPIAYVLVPIGIVAALLRGRAGRDAAPEDRLGFFLLVTAAASYALWLLMFSIYRYLIPIEMLVPLLLVVAVRFIVVSPRLLRLGTTVVLLAALPFQPSNRDRVAWNGKALARFIEVTPPADPHLADALVVVPGWHPGWRPNAFVIPFFPPGASFVRIVAHDDPAGRLVTGYDAAIASRIGSHGGPILVLMTGGAEAHVAGSLDRHGLKPDFPRCQPIATSIGGPLLLCPVLRPG